MLKVIKIENKEIPMMSNGGTLREYRHFFGRDLLVDFMKVKDAVQKGKYENFELSEIVEDIAWVLAHKANPNIKEIDKWLEQFDQAFSVLNSFGEIAKLLDNSMGTTVQPKKKKDHRRVRQ